MAGSYKHLVDGVGRFNGTQLIGNLGDAYEAFEECYGMIWKLAADLERASGGTRSAAENVDYARVAYQEGLQESPGRTDYAREQGAPMDTGRWGDD